MRIAFCLLAGTLLCGCAAKPPLIDPPREVRRPERLVPLGLVQTQPRTDVVNVPGNVEYALFPSAIAHSQALLSYSQAAAPQEREEALRKIFDRISMAAELCDQLSDPKCASPQ